jgi:HEAT repeat protein
MELPAPTTAPSLTAEDEAAVAAYFAAWWEVVREARTAGLAPARWKAMLPSAPVAALQAAALTHPNARVRRDCLGALDHEANDESVEVYRAALADPVPRVRILALHGLSCERCREGELCASDVVPTLVGALRHDPSAKVRHATIGIHLGLADRDPRATAALEQAAEDDGDRLVRLAAGAALDGSFGAGVGSRKALRRRERRAAG